MSGDQPVGIDTRDMLGVHEALRRALDEAPAQLSAVSDGDVERARRLSAYLDEVLWLLHAHHLGEDELLYPLLRERQPSAGEMLARMDEQHADIGEYLEAATAAAARFGATGSASDGSALAAACTSLGATLTAHTAAEEAEILPLASVSLSMAEWGALPGHALQSYEGSTIWLPFGLVLEAMEPDVREATLAHVPPPVQQMWSGMGAASFDAEMSSIRGTD